MEESGIRHLDQDLTFFRLTHLSTQRILATENKVIFSNDTATHQVFIEIKNVYTQYNPLGLGNIHFRTSGILLILTEY